MFGNFFASIHEDLIANVGRARRLTLGRVLSALVFNPGFHVTLRYRLSAAFYRSRLLRPLAKVIWLCNVTFNGCYISPMAKIGGGLALPHPIGIVIGDGARIGDNATIYQHVTLGKRNRVLDEYPSIGSGVTLFAGSVVIGGVSVGDNAIVGANAVLAVDLPPYGVAKAQLAEVVVRRPPG